MKSQTEQMLPQRKLLIPGPAEVEDPILLEMGAQVSAHYGPEWAVLYQETTRLMQQTFRTDGDVFLLVSSGNGGMEAAISSLWTRGDRVVIVNNGFFGERLMAIAQSRGLAMVEATAVWGQPIDPDFVAALLEQDPQICGLLAVHNETSTGMLNPIEQLGVVAKAYSVPFVVDAIASLGGETLAMDEWGIDICVASSNKCLGSFPGLAPVAVNPRLWPTIEAKTKAGSAGWYLNLSTWKKSGQTWNGWHPSPVTVSSNAVMALHTGLEMLHDVGLEKRIMEYKQVASLARTGLHELGFTPLVPDESAASIMTAVCARPSMDVGHYLTTLQQEYGLHVGNGLGALHGKTFRVGHLGKARSAEYVNLFLAATRAYCQQYL